MQIPFSMPKVFKDSPVGSRLPNRCDVCNLGVSSLFMPSFPGGHLHCELLLNKGLSCHESVMHMKVLWVGYVLGQRIIWERGLMNKQLFPMSDAQARDLLCELYTSSTWEDG
jgi:hypothetical protein